MAIAHFGRADQVVIDFSGAPDVNLSSVKLVARDLDTQTGDMGFPFTDLLNVEDDAGNNPFEGSPLSIVGVPAAEYELSVATGKSAVLRADARADVSNSMSAFTLSWQPVPEPSTGLLALLGTSVWLFRRRR